MTRRLGLPHLMALIAYLSAGLAAMKVASGWLARGIILGSAVALLVATLGAIVRRHRRSTWTGVSLFGWGYILLTTVQVVVGDASPDSSTASDFWGVDGPVRVLASRFFPEPSDPDDPFPSINIEIDPATGAWAKKVNSKFIGALTAEESKLQNDYFAKSNFYKERVQAAHHSRVIGLAFQGVAFALVGGVVGHFLSNPLPGSPDASTSSHPG